MNLRRLSSLQARLILLATLTVTIALGTACVGFVWSELQELQEVKRRQLQAQAEIVGFNAAAALLIDDAEAATQLLAPLAEQPTIAAAAIYSENGALLADYAAAGQPAVPSTAPTAAGHTRSAAGEPVFVQDVFEGGQRIGRLYLRGDMSDIARERREYLLLSLVVVAAALATSLPLAYAMARTISRPILQLSATADHITRHGDFSVRVDNRSPGEIGRLYRAFNEMLQRVDDSNRALQASQDELEERVEQRTAELQDEIRRRERIQQDLVVAKDAAEAASRAKSEFLANMSHEIRTPMNGILGLTELLLDTEMTRDQRDSMEMVKSSAEALMTVINDILDFSKIEARRLELDPVDFRLRSLAEETVRTLALRAHRKGLELNCEFDADVPDCVVGDAGRLRQILVNLIGNAIKFTDEGEIVVRAALLEKAASECRLHFSVIDTGIGIPPEKQQSIFEAFSQADSSTTRKYGGTGLGLTISSRLVALMGGELGVESNAGAGSTFYFDVRFGLGDATSLPERTAIPSSLYGMAVLVIDDNATNRRILDGLLHQWGAQPTCVDSGAAALAELARAAAAGQPYPLILVDAMMPAMDGFTLVEQIRRHPELDRPVVMMLTSADHLGGAQRCRQMGIAAYLIKPVRSAELQSAIIAALGEHAPDEHRHAAAGEARGEPLSASAHELRILLAEDNVVNQRVALRLLAKHGYQATAVDNGQAAIDALAREPFDVVLMDVQMPVLDGLAATRAIREAEAASGRHQPIIAMTAHAMQGDRERCLAAGMDGYVSKPIDIEELLRAIGSVKAESSPPAAPRSLPQRPATECVFDRDAALAQMDGDEHFLAEIMQVYLDNLPQQMSEIRAALAAADGPRLRRAAHSLKGASAYLSARGVASAALRLEEIAASDDLELASAALELLELELDNLLPALSALSAPTA